ncbi:MAG: hypothetical protein PUD02_04985 [Eggerthellales bacterium]|nr:hypothetical protein [Eggerthellales bacterium]
MTIAAAAHMPTSSLATSHASAYCIVWGNIAETGEVPRRASQPEGNEMLGRLRSLRSSTPRSEFLEGLDPEGLRRELEGCGCANHGDNPSSRHSKPPTNEAPTRQKG